MTRVEDVDDTVNMEESMMMHELLPNELSANGGVDSDQAEELETQVQMHLLTVNNDDENEEEEGVEQFLLERNDENLLTASKFKFVYLIKCCILYS